MKDELKNFLNTDYWEAVAYVAKKLGDEIDQDLFSKYLKSVEDRESSDA